MPKTCENWLSLLNSCISLALQTCEIYQVLPYSVDFKAPTELWNPLNQAVLSKCSFTWNKGLVNIWKTAKLKSNFIVGPVYISLNLLHCIQYLLYAIWYQIGLCHNKTWLYQSAQTIKDKLCPVYTRHICHMWLLILPAGYESVSKLRPRQNGCHFPYKILKCIYLNENVWVSIKISLMIINRAVILIATEVWAHRKWNPSASHSPIMEIYQPENTYS